MYNMTQLTLQKTWLILLILMVLMSLFAYYFKINPYFWHIILLFSGLKFWLVAFWFMEMRKAHILWKLILLIYVVFLATLWILLK